MVSRKKAKGRARKVAKAAKAAEVEEEKEEQSVAMINQERALEMQMQRLTMIGTLMRESGVEQCRHGLELESLGPGEKVCREALAVFEGGYNARIDSINAMLSAGYKAANENEKFAFVLKIFPKSLVSICVADAVQGILDGNDSDAQHYASFACYFEQSISFYKGTFDGILQGKETVSVPAFDGHRIVELQNGDMKTVVSFLRKRITCKCLNKKHKEVKSITKMGMCANRECSHPDGKVERKTMFTCTGCSLASYCSVECQKACWPHHKKHCKKNYTKTLTGLATRRDAN